MKLSSSWPNGRMLADNESGATWCASFSPSSAEGSIDVFGYRRFRRFARRWLGYRNRLQFREAAVSPTSSSSASSTDEINDAKSIRDCCCGLDGRERSSSNTIADARSFNGGELTLEPLDVAAALELATWVSKAAGTTVLLLFPHISCRGQRRLH
jgi:hypothetical protein